MANILNPFMKGLTAEVYTTKFASEPTGSAPNDWTPIDGTPTLFDVSTANALSGGKVLRFSAAFGCLYFTWDIVPAFGDYHFLTQLRTTNFTQATQRGGPIMKASNYIDGSDTFEHFVENSIYYRDESPDTYANMLMTFGDDQTYQLESKVLTPGNWVYIRGQGVGDTYRMKRWNVGSSEPAAWDIEHTQTGVPIGIFGYVFNSTSLRLEVRYISLGVNGGTPVLA